MNCGRNLAILLDFSVHSLLTAKLKRHYGSTRHTRMERAKFRSIMRGENESVMNFEVRLRHGVRYCGYTGATLNDCLVEQFIQGINNKAIAKKLLEKEGTMSLNEAVEIANAVLLIEAGSNGATASASASASGVSHSEGPIKGTLARVTTVKCFRCNREGHRASDKDKCRAVTQTCNTCGQKGHFSGAKFCKQTKRSQGSSKQFTPKGRKPDSRKGTQNQIEEGVADAEKKETSSHSVTFLCAVSNMNDETPKCVAEVLGENIPFLIDSGAVANIVSKTIYEMIKDKVVLEKPSKTLYAFGQSEPLNMKGQFQAVVKVQDKSVNALFFVYDGDNAISNLMSAKTARDLSSLHVQAAVSEQNLEGVIKSRYSQCFKGVGKLKGCNITLHVDPQCEPVAQPVRRVPFGYKDKVTQLLERLVAEDIIEPVEGVGSRWVSPIVIVPKSNGEVRMCIDMRQANKAIVRECYPIPTVQEMLVEMNGAKVFSKLDLRQGFFQCELETGSRDVTTFVTHMGLFRMKRLSMGVTSAPECFQYTIQKVLNGLAGVLNMADDIVVFGRDAQEHQERLFKVMDRLLECGLTLSEEKCEFGLSSVKFLGHIISAEGITADPEKVKAIVCARAPTNVSELRGFLGLVQYVGRYVPDLATVAAPLRELTKKSVEFHWGPNQEKSFKKIQQLMSSCETLAYFDRNAPITLVADASPVGLGAVLLQEQGGINRVIAYGHRSLSEVESRYSQTEREALGVVWACEHFKMYLLGSRFRLITDHKPLVHIYSNARSKPTPRLERWSLRLQPYDFQIVYEPGASNIADPMSRLSVSSDLPEAIVDAKDYIGMVSVDAVPHAMSWDEIQVASDSCPEVQTIKEAITTGKWDTCSVSVKAVKDELSVCDEVILRGSRILIPSSLRGKVLELAHEGHQGIVKCKQRLRSKVWWPRLDQDVEGICKSCESCQLLAGPEPPVSITPTKMPDGPWQFCSCDLLGPLPDGRSVIVVIDYYSRFFEAGLLKSTKTDKVVEFLDTIFCRFGYPQALRTDNGPQFISGEFRLYLETHGIHWVSTTPLWPQANGLVERANRTILKVLKIACVEKKDLQVEFRKFLVAYRSTPHSGTGCTPFALMFGREMRTKILQLETSVRSKEVVRDNDAEYKLRMKAYADRNASESKVEVGDTVVLKHENRSKLDPNFKPERFTVTGLDGSDMVVCADKDGSVKRRNVSFAKKLQSPSAVGTEEPQGVAVEVPRPLESSDVVVPKESLRMSTREHRLPVRFQDYHMY